MVYSDIKIVAERVQTEKIEFYQIENFLTKYECNNLIEIMKPRLTPSKVVNNDTNYASQPEKVDTNFRTSSTCHFQKDENILISILDSKISLTVGLDSKHGEPVQGQHYLPGQEFKTHLDPFPLNEQNAVHLRRGGQRTWTFMIYLNDVESGGETVFPEIPLTFIPKAGKAIFWNNLTIDSKGDTIINNYASHCGWPVFSGEKYILTKWFRELYFK